MLPDRGAGGESASVWEAAKGKRRHCEECGEKGRRHPNPWPSTPVTAACGSGSQDTRRVRVWWELLRAALGLRDGCIWDLEASPEPEVVGIFCYFPGWESGMQQKVPGPSCKVSWCCSWSPLSLTRCLKKNQPGNTQETAAVNSDSTGPNPHLPLQGAMV